jgi:hypothetical protein
VASVTPRPLYPQERAPIPIVEEVVWAPDPVGRGIEKRKSLFPARVRTPDSPIRNDNGIPSPLTHKDIIFIAAVIVTSRRLALLMKL